MANWGGAANSAVSGAAAGTAIAPGIGTAIGAGVGALGGLFGGGRKNKKKRSTFDKRQQKLNKQQYKGILGQGPLAELYNYDAAGANNVFNKNIADPAYQQYQENVVPAITGAFRSNGLMQSSYAGDALSRAGRDVQRGLDAERAKYLYGEQSAARTSKQNAIENYQNRTNVDYDTSAPSMGIDSILKSISPEAVKQISGYFSKPTTPSTTTEEP